MRDSGSGKSGVTIGTRLAADQAAFLDLPAVPYELCEKRPGWVRSVALVRYRK
jgi:hypothetical protein